MLPKIVAVIGPTASGKTALGVSICQVFAGEIVSADARQVFTGMDIGTAKELDLPVTQHLLDWKQPGERVTVAEFQTRAYAVIDELLAERKLPVLVGGSGLYAESIIRGYLFDGKGGSAAEPQYASLVLGIEIDREVLRARVATRTRAWLTEGLLEEITGLLAQGVSAEWLRGCGMEYRYFTDYLEGQLSLEEATHKTNIAINQFIKRQYTWWRRFGTVQWVPSFIEARPMIEQFLA